MDKQSEQTDFCRQKKRQTNDLDSTAENSKPHIYEVWVKNIKNEFLLIQKSNNLLWECCSRIAPAKEKEIVSCQKALKETLGIETSQDELTNLGLTIREEGITHSYLYILNSLYPDLYLSDSKIIDAKYIPARFIDKIQPVLKQKTWEHYCRFKEQLLKISNLEIDLTQTILETERLILRPFQMDDLDDFCQYAQNDTLTRMIGWPNLKERQDAQMVLNTLVKSKRSFALVYKKNQKVIGNLDLGHLIVQICKDKHFDGQKGVSLSFAVSEQYQRQGLIFEALKQVIDYIFYVLNADFINCGFFSFNQASKKLQEKLGFQYYCSHTMVRFGEQMEVIENILYKPKNS